MLCKGKSCLPVTRTSNRISVSLFWVLKCSPWEKRGNTYVPLRNSSATECCMLGNVGSPVLFSAMLAIIESAAETRVLANSLFQLVYIIL